MTKWMGAAAAVAMACSWAGGAQAYTYVAHGYISGLGIAYGSAKVGDEIDLYFGFGPSLASSYQFSAGAYIIDLRTGDYGSGDGGYFTDGTLFNDGKVSGGSFVISDFGTSFGPDAGYDGGFNASFKSNTANIPANPDQSFGPIPIAGSGGLGGVEYVFYDDGSYYTQYFSVNFNLTSLENVASIPALPLPPAGPMLGSALVALSAIGHGLKRRSRSHAS